MHLIIPIPTFLWSMMSSGCYPASRLLWGSHFILVDGIIQFLSIYCHFPQRFPHLLSGSREEPQVPHNHPSQHLPPWVGVSETPHLHCCCNDSWLSLCHPCQHWDPQTSPFTPSPCSLQSPQGGRVPWVSLVTQNPVSLRPDTFIK